MQIHTFTHDSKALWSTLFSATHQSDQVCQLEME